MTAAAVPIPAAPRAFTIERDHYLPIVWFGLPGEKVNKFSSTVGLEFSALIDELAAATDIKKIIFASRQPGIFIAGADVSEFTKATNVEEAREYVGFGQQMFQKLARLPQTTVAAIDGACLGGGCEMAISCDWRVITDSPKAQIGLPEVKLGIFPAWGGVT